MALDLNIVTNRDLITEARSHIRADSFYHRSGDHHWVSTRSEFTGLFGEHPHNKNSRTSSSQSIRRLGTATWDQVKTQLKRSFGVQQSYLKLKEEADAVKFANVSQYYRELIQYSHKLNLKYQLDDTKPKEFNTRNNEKSCLREIS